MVGGYRVIIAGAIAALLFTAFGFGWISGYALNNPTYERHQPYRYASDKPLEIDTTAPSGADAQAFEYRTPCDNPKGQSESDLCAQWYAAVAARSAATAAWAVGWVGAFIALLTLGAAWKAASYAKLAAHETMRTADLAADTHAADLRPYLFVSKIVPQVRDGGLIDFEIVLHNYGKLPARNIVIQHHACYTSSGDHFPGNVLVEPKIGIPVCAPGHERRVFEYYLMNEEERKAFDAGYGSIIIRIRYRYKGGPRRRPYAERIDYAYTRGSEESGHVYIVTSLGSRHDQPIIPNLLQDEKGGEEA